MAGLVLMGVSVGTFVWYVNYLLLNDLGAKRLNQQWRFWISQMAFHGFTLAMWSDENEVPCGIKYALIGHDLEITGLGWKMYQTVRAINNGAELDVLSANERSRKF